MLLFNEGNMTTKTIIVLLFSISLLFSNQCLSTAQINEQYFNEDVIGLYLSAIDFDSGESNFLLFDYSIDGFRNNSFCSDGEQYEGTQAVQQTACEAASEEWIICSTSGSLIGGFKIDFDISMLISGYHSYPEPVADGHINIFNIPSTLNSLSFRNTDLTIDTNDIQGASFELEDEQNYIDSQDDDIEELFISSGRVPNGNYYFNFTLSACDEYGECNQIDVLTKQIEVFVPSYIDLIYPGSNSISDSLSTQISNTFPTFQWNSDYCSNCDFSIRICEYKPLIHTSLHEALQSSSILPEESGYYLLDDNVTVFQYPTTGYESLNEGNNYVWQIKRSYETTNGTYDDFSEIFLFKIQSSTDINTAMQYENSDFSLDNIRLLIGENKFNELFGEGGVLFGFDNIESTMLLNNQNISINYLLEMIQKLNENQIEIINVESE